MMSEEGNEALPEPICIQTQDYCSPEVFLCPGDINPIRNFYSFSVGEKLQTQGQVFLPFLGAP